MTPRPQDLLSLNTVVWIKSSYSGSDGGDCVEVASTVQASRVRDSKVGGGPMLTFGSAAWSVFLGQAGSVRE